MLLSVPPPLTNGLKSPHEYSNHNPNPSRYSPPDSPPSLPSFFETSDGRMNNQHRGLPPPMGMTLPPPTDRGLPAMAPLGNLPAPPAQWTGADESMRNWLQAKAEEDRRRQEEEKTKQEGFRLDQRKIEQSMLRDSLSGGIPPAMVPLIFAGMGGSSLSPQTLEWAQHYMAQLSLQTQQHQVQQHQHQQQHQIQAQQQQQIQQQQHMSPDMRRDTRMIPPNPYGGHQPLQPALASTAQPSQPLPPQPPQTALARQGPPPSMPRSASSAGLSRLNAVDHIPSQQISTATVGAPPLHPLQQAQPAQQQEPQQSSAPGLFFHHWTPTAASTKSNQPPTPSGKSNQGSPFSQPQNSHLRSEYQNSPKKRKAAGGHSVPPIPTAQPPDSNASPPVSNRSSRERDVSPGSRNKSSTGRRHSRHHSDASSTTNNNNNNHSREHGSRNPAHPSSRAARVDTCDDRQHTATSLGNNTTEGSEDRMRYGGGGAGAETESKQGPTGPEMREHPITKREMEL